MKIKTALIITLIAASTSQHAHSQGGSSVTGENLDGRQFLSLTPDLSGATLKNGIVQIPFVIKNVYTEAIQINPTWNRIDCLMTVDYSGDKKSVEEFRLGNGASHLGGGPSNSINLRPGESGTFDGVSSMETLAFVAAKDKKIFGAITGWNVRTKQSFRSYSDPFPVPPRLSTPPWLDLGEQSYFSITPEMEKGFVGGGSVEGGTMRSRAFVGKPDYAERIKSGWADFLFFPVKITNTADKSLIAASDSISFYIVKDPLKRKAPLPWETVKAVGPILKPGESGKSSGRCYIQLKRLESEGYKPGDKVVAAVGGRVSGTNQIFECYSAPFELPPLPHAPPEIYSFPTPIRRGPTPEQTSTP